jgi:hypothetical protein
MDNTNCTIYLPKNEKDLALKYRHDYLEKTKGGRK